MWRSGTTGKSVVRDALITRVTVVYRRCVAALTSDSRMHVSWLIGIASTGFVFGVMMTLWWSFFTAGAWVVLAAALFMWSLRSRRVTVSILLAFVAGASLGLWRGTQQIQSLAGYDYLYDEVVVVNAVIAEDPSFSVDGAQRLRLKNVVVEGRDLGGEIWASVNDGVELKRSDEVVVEGRVYRGFGNLPAAMFRASLLDYRRVDYADVGRDVRDELAAGIDRAVKSPQSDLGSGFLLGKKNSLPEKLDQELRLLGLTHIVVASGYNLTIIIRYIRRWASHLSRFSALFFAGIFVLAFVAMTGWSPSMSRAGLIALVSLVAWFYGRKVHPFVLIAFTAALTVMLNPAYAYGDIGWLLSFTSFVGVIVLAPLIHAYYWGDKAPGNIRQVVVETMSAQLLTLPIIALTFGQYSVLSIFANLLILPLIPLTMLLTAAGGVVGLLNVPFAWLIGRPAELTISYMIGVVDRLARLPQAESSIEFGVGSAIVVYVLIALFIGYLRFKTGLQLKQYNVVE